MKKMTTTNYVTTKKKAIASKLRKLADDMEEISEQMNSLKEEKELKEWKEWSVFSLELSGSSEIVKEWADEIDETIK